MRITEQQLDEFINIYESNFGKRLPRAEALESALKLVNLVEILCKANINFEKKEN